jgi:flagellar biosynthesis chaperone FliJ
VSRDPRALQAVQAVRKQETERALAELVPPRRELAQREAALRDLDTQRARLEQQLSRARAQATEAVDVASLRWADDHLAALARELSQLAERRLAAERARHELAARLAELERRWMHAQLAERAVAGVLHKHAQAEQRRSELAEEERVDELARALPRPPHAK